MERREIILAKISNDKIIPVLIIENIDGELIGLKLRKSNLKYERDNIKSKEYTLMKSELGLFEVNIGQQEGLKSISIVSANRCVPLNQIQK